MSVNGKMTAIADAIRAKTGGTSALTLDQMAVEISGIETGGNSELEKQLIEGTVSGEIYSDAAKIRNYIFQDAGITKGVFPNATTIGTSAFHNANKLTEVYVPSVTKLETSAFQLAKSLTWLDFPALSRISTNSFRYAERLKTIVLRKSDAVCTLDNTSAFLNGRFASGGAGGVLLVPGALVTAYTEATNWSAIYGYGTNRFLALEDYTLDGTLTGEIDWDQVNALFEEATV